MLNRPYHGLSRPQAKADYEYEVTPDKVIVIIDQDRGNMSVTNDMSNVLADIARQEGLNSMAGHEVIYRDSTGRWDEVLLTASGQFGAFSSNGGTNEAHALELLRASRVRKSQVTGWASTKPGQNKYHYYQSDGKSLCSYQRKPGLLHAWQAIPYGRKTPEGACSSCELAFNRLPKTTK